MLTTLDIVLMVLAVFTATTSSFQAGYRIGYRHGNTEKR